MLKTWIEQIKNKPDHYGVTYWKYHMSGNILELSVKKEFLKQDIEFRDGVISIGKVLQALRQKLSNEGYQHHVQTFPNLDDSALIAAIRILSNSGNTDDSKDVSSTIKDINLMPKALKKFAKMNQLEFHELHHSDLKDVVIPSPDKKLNWYALCANHDNPFIWLRVGYWQEFMHNLEEKLQSGLILVTDTAISNNRLILNGSVNNRFVQLLIGIPKQITASS